ncbi:MAG: TonB-dependent receptor [Pseudomonadota bacterium]|nr:TonB-dependent receptor [Pseudomonadota bacterium]
MTIAFGGGLAATAATAQNTQQLERVEITGSAIKRIDAETAVPVTILRIDDLKKQGVTTIEQVLANVSAGQSQQGSSQNVGANNAGASFANLRGIGSNKTLILLNGRRIANSAFGLSAGAASVDLNTIPFAAIDRVEVLRDGASALYGTDAVGGVINFITKREFAGGTITLGGDKPKSAGGRAVNGNLGFGAGDLDKDNFNLFGFIDYQHQEHIGGLDRPFNHRIPSGLSPTTFPGNYFQNGDTGNVAASQPGGCTSSVGLIPSGTTGCQLATASFVDYIPTTERLTGFLKGTLKINDSTRFALEYFGAETTTNSQIAPVPYGGLYQNRTLPNGSLNPFYPGNPGSTITAPNIPLDPNYTEIPKTPVLNPDGTVSAGKIPGLRPGFVHVRFRDLPNGPRADNPQVFQQRLVATLDGALVGWDYQVGASYNQNLSKDFISGYSDGPTITAGVLNGVLNPYGTQTAAGDALFAGAGRTGLLQLGKGEVYGADFHASREIGDFLHAGRPAALAFGLEGRREVYNDHANTDFAILVKDSTGIDETSVSQGSRNVFATYAELNVPIIKELDVTAAVRYDKYSDFGSTTNPKFSFRYQPVQQALLRGSYSNGFRAPSLFDLHSSQAYGTGTTLSDPIRCPNGNPLPGVARASACSVQFEELAGGNPTLKPEKSKNATVGIVLEPIKDLTVSLDYFWIRLSQQIGSIPDTTVVDQFQTFASLYHRLPDGSLSTTGSDCPNPVTCGYIDLRTQNLGELHTRGLDLGATYRLNAGAYGTFAFASNTTYVLNYEYQDYTGGPFNQNVGSFVGSGPIFRWQSNANLNWTIGPWGAGIFGHYKSGYGDENVNPVSPAYNKVASYTTFDVYGTWAPTKALSLTLGVRNVFDRDPPFSNQNFVFQGGYDPRFTDPTGRTYYARGTYNF